MFHVSQPVPCGLRRSPCCKLSSSFSSECSERKNRSTKARLRPCIADSAISHRQAAGCGVAGVIALPISAGAPAGLAVKCCTATATCHSSRQMPVECGFATRLHDPYPFRKAAEVCPPSRAAGIVSRIVRDAVRKSRHQAVPQVRFERVDCAQQDRLPGQFHRSEAVCVRGGWRDSRISTGTARLAME